MTEKKVKGFVTNDNDNGFNFFFFLNFPCEGKTRQEYVFGFADIKESRRVGGG